MRLFPIRSQSVRVRDGILFLVISDFDTFVKLGVICHRPSSTQFTVRIGTTGNYRWLSIVSRQPNPVLTLPHLRLPGGSSPPCPTHIVKMDHDNYTYIAITFSEQSQYFDHPSGITSIHPSLSYCGRVGNFSDVHLVSMPKRDWLRDGSAILPQLMESDGVLHAEVQVPRMRSKRHIEELWALHGNVNFTLFMSSAYLYAQVLSFQ